MPALLVMFVLLAELARCLGGNEDFFILLVLAFEHELLVQHLLLCILELLDILLHCCCLCVIHHFFSDCSMRLDSILSGRTHKMNVVLYTTYYIVRRYSLLFLLRISISTALFALLHVLTHKQQYTHTKQRPHPFPKSTKTSSAFLYTILSSCMYYYAVRCVLFVYIHNTCAGYVVFFYVIQIFSSSSPSPIPSSILLVLFRIWLSYRSHCVVFLHVNTHTDM